MYLLQVFCSKIIRFWSLYKKKSLWQHKSSIFLIVIRAPIKKVDDSSEYKNYQRWTSLPGTLQPTAMTPDRNSLQLIRCCFLAVTASMWWKSSHKLSSSRLNRSSPSLSTSRLRDFCSLSIISSSLWFWKARISSTEGDLQPPKAPIKLEPLFLE